MFSYIPMWEITLSGVFEWQYSYRVNLKFVLAHAPKHLWFGRLVGLFRLCW